MTTPSWSAHYVFINPNVISHRICFNPNYGGPSTDVPGTCMVKIARAIKPKTREAIRKSIEKEGFRNPIILYLTSQGYLLAFGGGRLQAAKELSKMIPAIVVDYTGLRPGQLVTEDNWKDFFRDVHAHFKFTDVGIDTHYGLESGRAGEWYDPAGVEWIKDYEGSTDFLTDESPWLDEAI